MTILKRKKVWSHMLSKLFFVYHDAEQIKLSKKFDTFICIISLVNEFIEVYFTFGASNRWTGLLSILRYIFLIGSWCSMCRNVSQKGCDHCRFRNFINLFFLLRTSKIELGFWLDFRMQSSQLLAFCYLEKQSFAHIFLHCFIVTCVKHLFCCLLH
jgi:hypothetical protein